MRDLKKPFIFWILLVSLFSWSSGELPPLMPLGEWQEVLAYQKEAHDLHGRENLRPHYLTTPAGDGQGPSIMQRSGRKRLYDHNLFLRALFAGLLVHRTDGNLVSNFMDASFVDIGSAIVNGEGAPTCRDLFEDKSVYPFLFRLIATDINDADSRYVDTYFKSKNNLPFEVRAIPLELDTAAKIDDMTQDRRHALIFRSANSGPDLYYNTEALQKHFRAVADYSASRPLIYFFGKYVLYKPRNSKEMEIAGEVDPSVGFNHKAAGWIGVDWGKRSINQAFRPNKNRIKILEKSGSGP